MKTILFFAFMALAGSVQAQAFQLGIKGGLNLSNFQGSNFDNIDKKALAGYHAGAYMRFRLGGFSLQPEVQLSSQGARLNTLGNNRDYKVSYINVPVMFQYIFRNGFYLEAGPQIGFRASEDIPDNTIENFAKSTDFAVDFGLGYQTKFGLGIGGRYIAGVSKVGDFDGSNINPDFRNGVFQASLFFTLFGGNRRP